MRRMTMAEAEALDTLLTETDPGFTDIPGVFARERAALHPPVYYDWSTSDRYAGMAVAETGAASTYA